MKMASKTDKWKGKRP